MEDELALAAFAVRRHHRVPGDLGGNGRPVVAAHDMQAEVQAGGDAGTGQDLSIVDVERVGIDTSRTPRPAASRNA
jgi:hypothetical protein